jgi:hypothetical protein
MLDAVAVGTHQFALRDLGANLVQTQPDANGVADVEELRLAREMVEVESPEV